MIERNCVKVTLYFPPEIVKLAGGSARVKGSRLPGEESFRNIVVKVIIP